MMNVMARLALAIILVAQLVGCLDHPKNTGEQTKLKSLETQEKAAIKVLYPNKNTFFNNYGNYFNSKFPNVEFDVVPTQSIVSTQEIRQLIETENPDVLFLPTEQYEAFSNENMLMNLENLIKQSEFDIQNIHPSVLETIKGKSGGALFGLTPSFNNNALFYNKDLFEQYGVPFPKNKMTWDEVLNLAERFPSEGQGDNRIYGFAFGTNTSTISILNEIAGTLGLGFADSDLTKITFQTSGWKQAIELLTRALQSKAFYKSSDSAPGGLSGNVNDFLTSNLFVSKRAAMTIDSYFLISKLQLSQSVLKDSALTNWDVVTVPVDLQNPDLSSKATVSQIISINAKTANTRAAWEFVKFINGDEFARLKSRSTNELLSRSTYMTEKDGHSLQSFYMMRSAENKFRTDLNRLPTDFYSLFNSVLEQEINEVLAKRKSRDDALKSIEARSQEALVKSKAMSPAK